MTRHVQSGWGFQGVSKGVSNFRWGFQGVSLGGLRGFQILLMELCVCIKYLKLGEKTLPTLIQTNVTQNRRKSTHFLSRNPKSTHFPKIDASLRVQKAS